jgi:hypothetical protein
MAALDHEAERVEHKRELLVALIPAAAALLIALLSVVLSARAARGTAQLQDVLERRRQQASKEELLEQVMSRYREPLLRAAFDLQSRLYNIAKQSFLSRYLHRGNPAEQEYVLLADRPYPDATFRIFRGEQRAVGELMVDAAMPSGGSSSQCIGYAAFVAKLEREPSFARWFAKLEDDVRQLAADPSPCYDRLVALQQRCPMSPSEGHPMGRRAIARERPPATRALPTEQVVELIV